MIRITQILLAVVLASAQFSIAAQNEIERILSLPKAPSGVVFEIVSGQEEALTWAIPEVQRHAERLRVRFPGLSIAVVTHGNEQFALSRKNHERYQAVHNSVRQIKQDGIDVQVCGTHASWRKLEPEDFPDYVGVVAAAPVAINNYREIGYQLVVLRRPPNR